MLLDTSIYLAMCHYKHCGKIRNFKKEEILKFMCLIYKCSYFILILFESMFESCFRKQSNIMLS